MEHFFLLLLPLTFIIINQWNLCLFRSVFLSNKDVIIIGIIFGLFFFLPQWHKSRYNDEWMWKSSMKKTMMINWPTVCPTECLGQRSNDDDDDQLYNAKQLDFFSDWKWNQKIKKQWWFGQTFFRCFFFNYFSVESEKPLFVCFHWLNLK